MNAGGDSAGLFESRPHALTDRLLVGRSSSGGSRFRHFSPLLEEVWARSSIPASIRRANGTKGPSTTENGARYRHLAGPEISA